MIEAAFLAGLASGVLAVLAFQIGQRGWRAKFGPPTQAPRSQAQMANERYYQELATSRGEWRSTPLRRRVQRNAYRRRCGEETTPS